VVTRFLSRRDPLPFPLPLGLARATDQEGGADLCATTEGGLTAYDWSNPKP
jgi:hypothetical protein